MTYKMPYEDFKKRISTTWRAYLAYAKSFFEKCIYEKTGYLIDIQLVDEHENPIKYPAHIIKLLNPDKEIEFKESETGKYKM